MRVLMLVPYYIAWHYTRAIRNFITIWGNLISLSFSFFSVATLFRTLFAPYKRMGEKYSGGLDLENIFGTAIVNTMMRIVGMVMRSVLITVGLLCTLGVIIMGLGALVIWLVFPILAPFLFFAGCISVLTT